MITAKIEITYNGILTYYEFKRINEIAKHTKFKTNESRTSYKQTSIFIRNVDIKKIELQLEKIKEYLEEDKIKLKINTLSVSVEKINLKTKIAVIVTSTVNIFLVIVFIHLLSRVRGRRTNLQN